MGSSVIVGWTLLATLFLRIGVLGFGGPQAHLAMLRCEIVEQRQWLNAEEFDEGLALCEALPGPTSSQMAIYLGWLLKGWFGGLLSGVCFLIPGLLIVIALSELWRNGQATTAITTALQTTEPIIAAIVWTFAYKLWSMRPAPWQRITTAMVMVGMLLNAWTELTLPTAVLLLSAGAARLRSFPWTERSSTQDERLSVAIPLALSSMAVSSGLLTNLFSVFFKAGLLSFGGGLVIIPLLRQPVIDQGWLTSAEFLDGVAIGQISPGPVVLTSGFVGYQVGWNSGGWSAALVGAFIATVAIFLPSFLFILLGTRHVLRCKRMPRVKMFMDGLLSGIPGAIAGSAIPITLSSLQTGNTLLQGSLLAIALWLSHSKLMKPLPLVGLGLLIGVLKEIFF